jgi:hypothetical protein
MQEILSLSYDAGAASLLVRVAAVKESKHVPGVMVRQLGVPEPQAALAVSALPPDLLAAWRTLVTGLPGLVVQEHESAATPTAVEERSAALARREFELAQREAAFEATQRAALES